METVRDFIEDTIMIYDFTYEEDSEIFEHIRKHLVDFPLISKDNPDIKKNITECWDTDQNNFTEDSLYRLSWAAESLIIKWCVQYINKLKAKI